VHVNWRSKIHEWVEISWPLIALMSATAFLLKALLHCLEIYQSIGPDLIAPNGMPLGSDFISLWSAGWLALAGNAPGAYDPETIRMAHGVAVPAITSLTLYHYPPSSLLLLLPFSGIGYVPGLFLFVGVTLAGFTCFLWRLRPHWTTLVLLAGYPALWINILGGQNGFLSGLLICLALYGSTPFWQGLGWGLLTYKPHLGIPVPLALLISRSFKTIGWAVLVSLVFALAALLAFGIETYKAFLADTDLTWLVLFKGLIPLDRMPSALSAVLGANGIIPAAIAAQLMTLLIGCLSVIALWRQPGVPQNIRYASLVTAMLMATPHLFHYDLAIMALPLLLLLREAESSRWLAGERPVLLLLWAGPFLALPSGGNVSVNFYFLLLILLQLVLLRRARTLKVSS